MLDAYQVPALALTALLLPAFGYLYLRFRDTRTLLWFLGYLFAIFRMLQIYNLGHWNFSNDLHPWVAAAGQTCIQISSALFLASLSPLRFRVGRFNILYVIPFTIPLIVYSILFEGVYHGTLPSDHVLLVFLGLGAVSLFVGCFWGAAKGSMPVWLGVPVCFVFGSMGLWVCVVFGGAWSLSFVQCAIHFMTALLLIHVFRRVSPGVVLSVLGFSAWSLSILQIFPAIHFNPIFEVNLVRIFSMGKVVGALGMILLALEDQLAINQAAKEREHRARRELEAYSNLILSRRRLEDFDSQGTEICQTVVEHSRFAQAALLLQSLWRYRLAGAAGMDPAILAALERMATRIPAAGFLAPGSCTPIMEQTRTVNLDLTPWLIPGDDLTRLRFTSALAVPMIGRSATEGVLLLAGLRNPKGNFQSELRADDLLPVEMLVARLQATRSQTIMLEKLIDSEKFAGVGQLAANVTQQLNNPLTVILGYASLLEEASKLDSQEQRGVEAILAEARRMRSTLESLSRISRPHNDQLAAISVPELLADMEELHRPEFLQCSIEFRLNIAPSLPKVLCHAQQLRHAVLHCLQFAIDAVNGHASAPVLSTAPPSDEVKTIRLEATTEGNLVQILVAHSGPGFLHPERAFDPYASVQASGAAGGLGLSLCATILREHNGRASAVNFEPRGAAIILELQAA